MIAFDSTKSYILENDTVLLRPLLDTDYENLLHFAIKEPDIWKFSLIAVSGKDGLKNYIDTALAARAIGNEYPFIVFDKRTQQYAGSTRFYDIQLHNKSAQLGYTWYGKSFQGTGLNKNCKLLLLQFAFENLELERVEFRADNNNERSKAAMKSIGCVEEGVLRSHVDTFTGIRRNSVILSILKQEWYGGVKENLAAKIN
ncbi:MAG: GNAT family protein [Ferruginibacter sp.]|nr:GNAT family N-acetyltransferase [Ferruginibacter sp.]